MSETLLADGMLTGVGDHIATIVVKCLAVGGGFLVGYFLGGLIGWALDRWVFAQKAPEPVKKAVALVSGIALAILVALVVFGEGGSGLFGGAGGGGTANPDGKNKGDTNPPVVPPKKEEVPPKKPTDPVTPPKPADSTIRVTILGGSDVPGDERFYRVDDDPNRKSFPELKKAILDRKQMEKGTLGVIVQFPATNAPSLDPPHYSITQLQKWAREEAKVDVTIPAQK